MKKLMVMMTLGLILFSGSVFAQTATEGGSDAKDKKETIKAKPVKQGTAVGVKTSTAKKAKVKAHKDEIKAKADSKEEAKEMIQDKKAGDASKKEKVKAHKDEIKAKADSKEEAKAKLQRKHDKNKDE